jgi:hypothetical protein
MIMIIAFLLLGMIVIGYLTGKNVTFHDSKDFVYVFPNTSMSSFWFHENTRLFMFLSDRYFHSVCARCLFAYR